MLKHSAPQLHVFFLLFWFGGTVTLFHLQAQTNPPPARPIRPLTGVKKNVPDKLIDASAIAQQERQFAVSLITTLADEARTYNDLALRPRILARSADALWDTDNDRARTLFRRAWDAAEKADAEDASTSLRNTSAAVMLIAMPKTGGSDLRSEVFMLAGRRDRALSEEFLAKLIEAKEKTERQVRSDASYTVNDGWTTSDESSKRLELSQRLLDDGEVERAFEFAAPALFQVNQKSIGFLSKLRLKKPDLADRQFMLLLARAEADPTADANVVSGLSSYAFTPGLYLTFFADGGVNWIPVLETLTVPDLPIDVRNKFFQVSAGILLRPSPPPDQDRTSAGLIGRYMVIKRLLPLFEGYAPDSAVALRSELTALAERGSSSLVDADADFLRQGIERDANAGTLIDRLEERVSRAKSEQERDSIYSEIAAALATQGDLKAQEIADKIENSYRREMTRQYVDLSLFRLAIARKDVATATRLARLESLNHVQRTWAFTQIAKLLLKSDRTRGVETLEEALAEARRIDADDENRARMMIGIANQFLTIDTVRPWEVGAEAVKAANSVETFSGDDSVLTLPLIASSGLKLIQMDTCSLAAFFSLLVKLDLTRANDLAKDFKYDAPRAVATLAIARAALSASQRGSCGSRRSPAVGAGLDKLGRHSSASNAKWHKHGPFGTADNLCLRLRPTA